MNPPIKPIYLFADSQLLFWSEKGSLFLRSVRDYIESQAPKAAYIGASNGDNPDFYSIFEAAMENAGITDCKMIPSSLSPDDKYFLERADIILLAGGDVEMGWRSFEKNGLKELIIDRYSQGAVLIGISAGAVQLGMVGWSEDDLSAETLLYTFGLVPMVISAHDERQRWERLKKAIEFLGGWAQGIGIPTGGGMIVYPDQTIEPIRHPLHEFSTRNGQILHTLLFSGDTREVNELSD